MHDDASSVGHVRMVATSRADMGQRRMMSTIRHESVATLRARLGTTRAYAMAPYSRQDNTTLRSASRIAGRSPRSSTVVRNASFGPNITAGRMSYDLRRLRLHGLIERVEGTHRYLPTPVGLRTALFYSRVYARVLRPGLSILHDERTAHTHPIASRMRRLQKELDDYILEQIAA